MLDSVAELGGADGNIDDEQFQWLHGELLKAEQARQFAFVFAHHSLRTMNQAPIAGFPPGDQGGNASPLLHFGVGLDPSGPSPCLLATPAQLPTPDETLRCLFLRHPSVVAFVVGHEHLNRIVAHERETAFGLRGGFSEITTASHIDWPQQSRLIELFDNRDGTLSIFGTLLDHAANPQPALWPADGHPVSASLLATVSRELSYNDPDAQNDEDGEANARGQRIDRNVELLLPHPYQGSF